MNNKFESAHVTLSNAKLLKELGFHVYCPTCYGMAILHNGEYLGCDEEYELRAEGRENEIEYVDGGMIYDLYTNNTGDDGLYARPTQDVVFIWLRKRYNVHIVAMPYITTEGQFWVSDAYTFGPEMYDKIKGMTTMLCNSPEEANEKTLGKVLKDIIQKENERK